MIRAQYHLHNELILGSDGSRLLVLAVASPGEVSMAHTLPFAVVWDAIVDTAGGAFDICDLAIDGFRARLDPKVSLAEDAHNLTGWRISGSPLGRTIAFRAFCDRATVLGIRTRSSG